MPYATPVAILVLACVDVVGTVPETTDLLLHVGSGGALTGHYRSRQPQNTVGLRQLARLEVWRLWHRKTNCLLILVIAFASIGRQNVTSDRLFTPIGSVDDIQILIISLEKRFDTHAGLRHGWSRIITRMSDRSPLYIEAQCQIHIWLDLIFGLTQHHIVSIVTAGSNFGSMPPLLLVRLGFVCHVWGIGPLPNDKRTEIVVWLVSWLVFRLLFRKGLDHQLLNL